MTTFTQAKLAARSSAKQVRPGDRVRIIAGQLAGLTGVVYRTDGANAVLAAGGLKGVYVRLSITELQEYKRTIEC